MLGKVRPHLTYANVVATICLFLLLGGGTALATVIVNSNADVAEDTISGHAPPAGDHPNIISNSVSSGDLKNEDIRSGDVRDATRVGGGLTGADITDKSLLGADLANGSIGPDQLANNLTFKARSIGVNDPVGGGPTNTTLIDTDFGYEFIGRCDEPTTGTVKASIVVKTVSNPRTMAVDSNAQGGVNDVVNVPHGTEETLASLGPTVNPHIASGEYGVTSFENSLGGDVLGMTGNVSVATNFGNSDCRFDATAWN